MSKLKPATNLKLYFPLAPDQHETLLAVLGTLEFYAFEELDEGLNAYTKEVDFQETTLKATLDQFFAGQGLTWEIERIEDKDWNAEWEKNFAAIQVDDFCEVRPPFRASSGTCRHELIVMPRMAFGTGHHATTWMMIQRCSQLDFTGKKVLDMGCGTGLLAILALKLGAAEVCAIDIDSWSHDNCKENAEMNGVRGLNVICGDANSIPSESCYDIILANINRNILLADRDKYLQHLKPGAEIVLSGIYDFDEEKLSNHFAQTGLKLIDRSERKEWVRLSFQKPSNLGNEQCS